MLVVEAPPRLLAAEPLLSCIYFQPEAGNEVLKEFQLKLTPMGKTLPLPPFLPLLPPSIFGIPYF
ncbi:hypothetical protein [Nostoc sp.]